MLYECLTGSRPYPADSLEQQIAGHMVSPPPRPSAIDPKLAAFDDVIAKGMAKKPAKRYQTAGELAAAARRALDDAGARDGSLRAAFERKRARRGCRGGRLAMRPRWCWWPRSARSGRGSGGADRGGGDTRPASVAESSSTATPVAGPGAVPADRGDRARGHQEDGPVGDRCQRAVCAKRIQELRR